MRYIKNTTVSDLFHKNTGMYLAAGDYIEVDENTLYRYDDAEMWAWFLAGDVVYSEDGILISKGTRQRIFTMRDFLDESMSEGTLEDGNRVKISNTKAKKINNSLDWVRKYIRQDVGLTDLQIPQDEE